VESTVRKLNLRARVLLKGNIVDREMYGDIIEVDIIK
jgi:hypothetical protein